MAEEKSSEKKDGAVTVRILKDGLECAITVMAAVGEGKEPTLDTAHAAMRKEKVLYGIDVDILQSIFRDKIYDREIVVAFGKPAVDGKDGETKYFFDTDVKLKPKEDDKGNVDFKDIQLLQNVKKGQKLAEVIPPVPGTEGKTVRDVKIVPVPGKVVKIPRGLNTEVSVDSQNVLIASTDGNVSIKNSLVQVENVYVIDGDVAYETGNIESVGSLLIKGDVKSGFEIKTSGDIEINGLVEDAKITAGGNVFIKNGFLGKGNGFIQAGGDVTLKFCSSQNIKAKGDIIVGEAVLHSNLQSESKIDVTGRKGSVIGGVIRATKGIVVKELSNYQETKTEVIVGIDEELMKKMDAIEEEKKKSDENHDNIKKAIYALYKKKMKSGGLQEDQEKMLGKLQSLQEQIPEQRKQLEEKKEKIEEEMQKYSDVSVDVLSTVYPGTRITMLNHKKVIKEERKKVQYKVIEREVKELSL